MAHIQGVSLPNQRVLADGAHVDAFVPHEQRQPEGPHPEPVRGLQGNQWQHGAQRVAIEEVEDGRSFDDVVTGDPESSHPLRSASRASFRLWRATPYDRAPRDESSIRRATSRNRTISRSLSTTSSITPECYLVTSDVEDDYSRGRNTEELYTEMKGFRATIDKSTRRTRFIDKMIDE